MTGRKKPLRNQFKKKVGEKVKKKSEAQVFLEKDELLKVKIECKLAERQQWRDLALSITQQMGGERVQSSGSKDKMGEAVTKCLSMADEIVTAVNDLAEQRREITAVIDQVDNPTWLKLLHQRYIQHEQLKTIAVNFNSSYDWAKSTHGRAVKQVQKILNNISNSEKECT